MPNAPAVLWLDPVDFIGGAELFSRDVLPFVAPEFRIRVLSGDPDFFDNIAGISREEFSFPRLRPIHPLNLARFWRSAAKLKAHIAENAYDIVHTNSIRSHIVAAQAVRNIPKQKRPKLIFFVHDFTFPKWSVQLFAREADAIIACSQAVKNDLHHKGIPVSKISVIPNGIDPKKFKQRKASNEKKHIGIIGRLDPWKGQDVFLKALNLVRSDVPDVHAHIFGESSAHDRKTQHFEKTLKDSILANDLENTVTFHGFTPAEKALSQIDLLVHASTNPEPFGRVVIEAMAAGVPVIASNLGGPQEIISHGKNGLLIEPKNPEKLAETILTLLRDKTLRDTLIKNGKETVGAHYTLDSVTKKLANIWKSSL